MHVCLSTYTSRSKPTTTTHQHKPQRRQVKGAEIVASKSYSLQYTLRFPRIKALRANDKARAHAFS